jgi:hypothetical protein
MGKLPLLHRPLDHALAGSPEAILWMKGRVRMTTKPAFPALDAPTVTGFGARGPVSALSSIGELQDDLDEWIKSYNEERPHQGRWCFGKTPPQTFLDAIPIAREKTIAA